MALGLNEELIMEEVFTTGQVAKLCRVSTRTAAKWIDKGMLKGWRIPGGKDRRVKRSELVAFLARHGMPTLEEFEAGVDFHRYPKAKAAA